jgi:hypothetical protein
MTATGGLLLPEREELKGLLGPDREESSMVGGSGGAGDAKRRGRVAAVPRGRGGSG